MKAYIGIGSNLQDPVNQVNRAVETLAGDKAIELIACSSLYRSEPIGVVNQPNFINAVCMIETGLSVMELLDLLQAIELAAGRQRSGERWGPRTLDLDLLMYGNEQVSNDRLTVPHPRMHERAFVLYPLLEIDAELDIPGKGLVRELLSACVDQKCVAMDPGETMSGSSKPE